MKLFHAVLNSAVRALLRSPLHRFMSGNTMLLSYRGRRSGKAYELPVSYVRDGSDIDAFGARDSLWWRNLLEGPEVTLLVGGEALRARAQVEAEDHAAIGERLGRFLTAVPRDAMPAGVRLRADGTPDPVMLAAAAARHVAVRFAPIAPDVD